MEQYSMWSVNHWRNHKEARMLTNFILRSIDLSDEHEISSVRSFLAQFDLGYDQLVDYTTVLEINGIIAGTGSFSGEVLRNIAIDENLQGEGLTSAIINDLMQEQARRGIMHRLIFTKPSAARRFSDLGFKEIARAEPWAVLLESGPGGLSDYLEEAKRIASSIPSPRTAVVVNCNPFTRGHLKLLETASEESAGLIIFVVSEDRSLFPFKDRIDLVRRGTAHLRNAVVIETSNYIVSTATFPTYFTREEHLATAQAHLDVALFAQKIAPALNINARYVGEEPYCPVTEAYNQAMRDILPSRGIRLKIIPRFHAESGEIISASTVRDCIRRDDWDMLRELVPDVTWNYLRSPEQASLLAKIKASSSRH